MLDTLQFFQMHFHTLGEILSSWHKMAITWTCKCGLYGREGECFSEWTCDDMWPASLLVRPSHHTHNSPCSPKGLSSPHPFSFAHWGCCRNSVKVAPDRKIQRHTWKACFSGCWDEVNDGDPETEEKEEKQGQGRRQGTALELAGSTPSGSSVGTLEQTPLISELTLLLLPSGRPQLPQRRGGQPSREWHLSGPQGHPPPSHTPTLTHISLPGTCIDLLSTGHLDTWGTNDDLSPHRSVSTQAMGDSQVYTLYRNLKALRPSH